MTGPRKSPVHPHRRPGRRLLPFLLAVTLAPLACTSDQPTEVSSQPIGQMAAATGRHPRARIQGAEMAASSTRAPRASFSIASSTASNGSSVLILADVDGAGTPALADTLAAAGFQVTVRPGPEYTWDGTNPALAGFDVVVHLNGSTYDGAPVSGAQQALNSFVQNGGGYVGAQWNGAEFTPDMPDLILQAVGSTDGSEQNCAVCQVTFEAVAAQSGHPVLAGLPSSFTFTADGHDGGTQIVFDGTTVLMHGSSGGPAVLARDFGTGKVVNFSFAPNYPFDDAGMPRDWGTTPPTLQDQNIKGLYVNAVAWAAGSAGGQAEAQTITFSPLADKVYGDAAFTVSASASSTLPVSFIAAGQCTIVGATVTITGAGTCTITAQQAGNDNFQPAPDVSQSFNIAKAAPVISWTPAPITTTTPLGPTHLNASATGIGGVALTGSFVYTPGASSLLPTGTASLSVEFSPSDLNYAVATLTISVEVTGGLNFSGFYKPIKNMPAVNVIYAGTSIPMKFAVRGYRGSQVIAPGAPTSVEAACPSGAPEHNAHRGAALGRGGLHVRGYTYAYVWKTNPGWAGTCRKFVLTLVDGSTHEALFRFVAKPVASTASRSLGVIGR
jgi:hypothetical protein